MKAETASSISAPVGGVLWDVIEEHFDEAEFLFEQWERALRSPGFTLAELGATLEARLEAHLDALVIGGPDVSAEVLIPQLENADEPTRATVAALVLLISPNAKHAVSVLDAAQAADAHLQPALARALALTSSPSLDNILLDRFRGSQTEAEKSFWLEILADRGVNPGVEMDRCLFSDDARLAAAALKMLTHFPRREMLPMIQKHWLSNDSHVRMSALKAGLILHSPKAWELCLQWARSGEAIDPELLSLIAMLGTQEDHRLLYSRLDQPTQCERIIWTLAFCGTVEAGDACLVHLRKGSERAAKAAADTLAWIGGLDLEDDAFEGTAVEPTEEETLPPIEEDDLQANLDLDGIDDLPVPNRVAVAQWWEKNHDRLAHNARHVFGQPFSPQAVVRALQEAPLWRRHGVALEFFIRSGGKNHVSTKTFTPRQRKQMGLF